MQELLAPKEVHFYSKDWKFLGTRVDLKDLISSITRIPDEVLAGEDCQPPNRSIAEVLSWASRRHTTVVEDTAYSLLGLLDISMPLLYGEGPKAFLRLQEEILKKYDDESLFAWEAPPNDKVAQPYFGLLSPSVSYFDASHRFRHPTIMTRTEDSSPRTSTSKGISAMFPRIDANKPNGLFFALLDCKVHGSNEEEIQPAIQIHHLGGNQYGRMDVHHIHDVRLDRLPLDMFHPNCPMIFPAKPQPPRPITGFVFRKEQRTEGYYFANNDRWCYSVDLVDHYPPHGWVDCGLEHVALNLTPGGVSQPTQPFYTPIGVATIEVSKSAKGYQKVTCGVSAHIVTGIDTINGQLPGAPDRRRPWGCLMLGSPKTSAAETYRDTPSRLLSQRPTTLSCELPQDGRVIGLALDIVERQWPGRVMYEINFGESNLIHNSKGNVTWMKHRPA